MYRKIHAVQESIRTLGNFNYLSMKNENATNTSVTCIHTHTHTEVWLM